LRFFNVYGPGQLPHSPYAAAVPRFIAALKAGRQPIIYGDGQQTRDFVYVGDVAAALVATATSSVTSGIFNVGRGEECSVLQLVDTIAELLEVAAQPQHAPPRAGEVRRSCADVRALAHATGFRAPTSLPVGLRATLG
jgi:nucleoside-diphosphate-sugar epimerase